VYRPFAVIKRVFEAGHLMDTGVARVHVRNSFSRMDFNFRHLLTLQAQAAERELPGKLRRIRVIRAFRKKKAHR